MNIGVAAHITAASPDGPRYDECLSQSERKGIRNGIWLCQNCAKLIDNDPNYYSIAKLKIWKQRAEEKARRRIESNDDGSEALIVGTNPPIPFVAHDYSLGAKHPLIGRDAEIEWLRDWWRQSPKSTMVVTALGGVGKSAVAWKFFESLEECKEHEGAIWWSFYEPEATFENFVFQALLYFADLGFELVSNMSQSIREAKLLEAISNRPVLLVLDGLERLLVAYEERARLGSLDEIESSSILANQRRSELTMLRETSDAAVGHFISKLVRIPIAKTIVTTRIVPSVFEDAKGEILEEVLSIGLTGLSDDSAYGLWNACGANGNRSDIIQVIRSFDNHPLLIKALAGDVARNLTMPGDWEDWKSKRPDFDPFQFKRLVTRKSHVLQHALRGLTEIESSVLFLVSAFRMPVEYETLISILVDVESLDEPSSLLRGMTEPNLDEAIVSLSERGLLGQDTESRSARFDIHPIIRGVVWRSLSRDDKIGVCRLVEGLFESGPSQFSEDVDKIEDLKRPIELYHLLVEQEKFDQAWVLFRNRLSKTLHNQLSASYERATMLERLFPKGMGAAPMLTKRRQQAWAIQALGESYLQSGRPGKAVVLLRKQLELAGESPRLRQAGLNDLSDALCESGELKDAYAAANEAIEIKSGDNDRFWHAVSLGYLSRVLTVMGRLGEAATHLKQSVDIFEELRKTRAIGVANALQGELALFSGNHNEALNLGDSAWQYASEMKVKRDFARAARIQGIALLRLSELDQSSEWLNEARVRSRDVMYVEEYLPSLIGLGEIAFLKNDFEESKRIITEVLDYSSRGPYPIYGCDCFLLLAKLHSAENMHDQALQAASKSLELAICDGKPYAYAQGINRAKTYLEALSN